MDAIPDPVGLLTALAALVPGAAKYLPGVLTYLSLAGGLCVLLTAFVTPPSSAAPAWWVRTYRVISYVAGNFGHARNAVIAGMLPGVIVAATANAKLVAAAPELAQVVTPPAIPGAILPDVAGAMQDVRDAADAVIPVLTAAETAAQAPKA